MNLRWKIFWATWIAYAGMYLTRKSFSVAKIEMGEGSAVGLTVGEMSWIDSAHLGTYAIGQFLFGMMGDKYGARKVVLVGMITSAIVSIVMGASHYVIVIGMCFAIQGLCQSTGWGPLTKNLGAFFPASQRGRIMGLWSTNYAIGGIVASVYAGYVGEKYGYPYAFYIPAITLLCITVVFFIFQQDAPKSQKMGEKSESVFQNWKSMILHTQVGLLGLVYFCVKPTRYAILFWGPLYLNHRLGTNMMASGLWSSMFELAGVLSVLLGGWLTDVVFRYKRTPLCVLCFASLAVVLIGFNHIPMIPWVFGFMFFLVGIFLYAPDSIISGVAAMELVPEKQRASATGFVNGCGSVGAILGGALPGIVHHWIGWSGLFYMLSFLTIFAGILLIPLWNRKAKG